MSGGALLGCSSPDVKRYDAFLSSRISMVDKRSRTSRSNWSTNNTYAALILIIGFIGAGATLYSVWSSKKNSQDPPATGAASPIPNPPATPPPATTSVNGQNICGVWLSETSHKQYDFVCKEQGSVEIYEISNQGLTRVGAGKITEAGNLEADFHVQTKNRWARLQLKLSPDGQTMEGSYHGSDLREVGRLTFHRV